jgi:peptidyl-prolyl cis-trans isomerase D
MTMLDSMRRHRHWLKWVLLLVVLSFIAFYVPDFLSDRTRRNGPGPNQPLASVNGEPISVTAFRRAYQQRVQAFRNAYGASFNEQMLKQLGIEQQILRQLIDERTAVAEARRLGLSVSDAEVAQRIYEIPAFQRNGVFDEEYYSRLLASQRPPLSKVEFEESLRRSLLVDKLRAALTEWVSVPDTDVESEYRHRNEKVKAELVVLSADALRNDVSVTDQDVAAWYASHKGAYRIGEKRKIKYLLIDTERLRAKAVVLPADVERYYRANEPQFATPEQVRASHILLKTEGKDEAAVKARAEALLKQAKAGADFAELAKKNSEDQASAAQGGDLDYFGRGRMAKEFEDAAFGLASGQISDVVKSPFGFHIIKVTDRKPETKRTLDEVRGEITERLSYERAQTQVQTLGDTVAKQITSPADLDKVARARGLTVQESGYFSKDEPIAGFGPAPEITDEAFTLKEGTVAGPVRTARGIVFFATIGRQDARVPEFAAVKDKVKEDALRQKARELSKTRAEALSTGLSANFAATAKSAGLAVKTTEVVARGTAWPDVGINPAVDEAIFQQPMGGVTRPIVTDGGTVVARVVERQSVTPEDLAKTRDGLKQELVADRRTKFFSAYMVKARERMKIQVNQDVLRTLAG